MHLVDALAKMQLTASNKAATCVPFSAYNVKMTLLKGPDALAARRAVASKLDHSAIKALRRPMHVDKPDWSLMQQLSDAGIGVCPTKNAVGKTHIKTMPRTHATVTPTATTS